FFLFALLLLLPHRTHAQPSHADLRKQIDRIALAKSGTLGVAMQVIETGDTLTYNGSAHQPMQSVYKFPLAMAVLEQVDEGRFSLDTILHLGKRDLLEETWSPLRDKYPSRRVDVSLRDVIRYAISESDNNA